MLYGFDCVDSIQFNILNGSLVMGDKEKKNVSISNLIEGHSWLGVVISLVLFLVFWAGSISLFMEEIEYWAEVPHHPIDERLSDLPLRQIVEKKLTEYDFDADEHLTVIPPNDHSPYYYFYIDLIQKEIDGKVVGEEYIGILVDPKTGETIRETGQFHLARFIYILHYNLNLPGGTYMVGIVTLLFFFLIISGIFIHAKKLIRNFFLFRAEGKRRSKLLDIHNVVGVMSLPFTIMYALSGLIFNLAIVYQISFALLLYGGDQTALLSDAGYYTYTESRSGNSIDMARAYSLVDAAANDTNQKLNVVRFYNYGDQNAAVQIISDDREHFAQRNDMYYRVSDGAELFKTDIESYNVLRKGTQVIASLHFGDFAGIDLRLLYFILGLAICGMIVVGNLLWIDKRSLQKNVSEKSIRFVKKLTTGGCTGVVVATAIGFFLERILSVDLTSRPDYIVYSYSLTLLVVGVVAFLINDYRQYIIRFLQMTACILWLTILADWILLSESILRLISMESYTIVSVQLGLFLFSLLCLFVAMRIKGKNIALTNNKPSTEGFNTLLENSG